MNYQNESLPKGAILSAKSPVMTEKTTPDAIQKRHRAPKGKTGCLKVLDGTLQFQWCDTGETFDAVPGHPIVISPERSHRVIFSGPVRYRIEFFSIPGQKGIKAAGTETHDDIPRPGEQFFRKKQKGATLS